MNDKGDGVKKNDQPAPADQQGVKDKSSDAPGEKDTVDYKELLRLEREAHEKTKEERENYKKSLTQKRQLRDKDEGGSDDDEISTKISEAVEKAVRPLQEAISGNKFETVLSGIVPDAQKRELVKFHYENSIVKTGTSEEAIRSDLSKALALVDSTINKRKAEEAGRMNDNHVYVPPAAGGNADRGVEKKPHQWTADQEQALRNRAMSIGLEPEKYILEAWNNFSRGTAFATQKRRK